MVEEGESKKIFRQTLTLENGVILPLMRDISIYAVTDELSYQKALTQLAIQLPETLRIEILKQIDHDLIKTDLTPDGKKFFREFQISINTLLERANIAYPRVKYHEGKL